MLIEDESGDQVGEYLRKTNQENAICDWCMVTAKIAKYAHLGRKNHNIYSSHGYTVLAADIIFIKYQAILACRGSLGTYRYM